MIAVLFCFFPLKLCFALRQMKFLIFKDRDITPNFSWCNFNI